MKANELMIGDWVEYRFTGWTEKGGVYKNYQDVQISTIGDLYIKANNDRVASADGALFYPIPLTPEILEKNGFRETDMVVVGIRKMRWESEDGRTEITIWMDDTMPMEIRKNIYYEDEECYTLPFAWAVHKLQHALRICGIEKEIEL